LAQLTRKSEGPFTAVFPAPIWSRRLRQGGLLLVGLIVLVWISRFNEQLSRFPETWNLAWREPLNEFKRWVVVSRNSHWMFLFFFEPLSAAIDFSLRRVEALLLWLPWPVLIGAIFLVAKQIRGWRLGTGLSLCLFALGWLGLWSESMQTLALMVTAVYLALLLGIPLGIWSAQSDRVEKLLRPVLDAMQTMTAFVYLIPVVLFFGVARVPSIIATVIYALPPVIRLTNLGLRAVSPDVLEAARAFGSTERQILRKVRLPLALPAIMVGVNQTIMMALSIVVIAALIGAGGLGDVVLKSLRRLQVGSALEAGLAIVLLAIVLDRLTQGVGQWVGDPAARVATGRFFRERWVRSLSIGQLTPGLPGKNGRFWLVVMFIVVTITGLLLLSTGLRALGVVEFPAAWRLDLSGPVDNLVGWMQVNLYEIGNTGLGTGPLRDFLIIKIFRPITQFLTTQLPWIALFFILGSAAWLAAGWRLGGQVLVLLTGIGLLGMWVPAMDTLGQVLVAVLLCVGVGFPVGILAAQVDWLERILRLTLDFLQTIPIFVYLVPVIMLFGTGSVAALIAAVVYAVAPVIRLTNAGIRGVDKTVRETAVSFGATRWQILLKVELPLAFPAVLLGINQTIMMVLAMVIIAGLVGATGLGLEVYQGFANDNLGRSVEAGLAIVLLAMVIDRITEKLAGRAGGTANPGGANNLVNQVIF
jgi:glycine betaine/proline transport system permease protein